MAAPGPAAVAAACSCSVPFGRCAGECAAAFSPALLTRLLSASPTCSVVSISGVSRNALCPPGAAPRLAQQRRSQPLSLAGGGAAARPRPIRCAAGSRGVPGLAYSGSAVAARPAAGARRSPAAASAYAFTSVALRGGGTLCYRLLPASMGAAPSSVAAGPSRRPAYGSGSSSNLTRSRRMVLLSAAAPEAPAPPAPDAAGVSVEFDNDSGETCCCARSRAAVLPAASKCGLVGAAPVACGCTYTLLAVASSTLRLLARSFPPPRPSVHGDAAVWPERH